MPQYHVKHITKYNYESPVTDSANQIILDLQNRAYQDIVQHEVRISPVAAVDYYFDYFGNKVGTFTIVQPHTSLSIVVDAEVMTKSVLPPTDFWPAKSQWENIAEVTNTIEFLDFVKPGVYQSLSEIKSIAHNLVNEEMTVYQSVNVLLAYVYQTLTYQQGVTNVETAIDQIWELKAGVCQDFAHLLIEMLRMCKIPSRYVSGYICPMGNELRGVGATHAWVEAYIPDYGWLGVDPTNNCLVSDRHIIIAFGRNFNDCTPVKGTYKGSSEHTLSVAVIITNEKITEVDDSSDEKELVYVKAPEKEKDASVSNSYQKYLEMQQQQQQQ